MRESLQPGRYSRERKRLQQLWERQRHPEDGSVLAFGPEQLPHLQHQLLPVVVDADGRRHALCGQRDRHKWAQGFVQHGDSYVHPNGSSVWGDLRSVDHGEGQRV